ncbi:MAG TPA: 2-C-methyl-D-erythritol 2,4-cyclodiphosphate synthase [Nitrospiria bacterium]|nr:2-C-methyl-D-erythritol 2,4-cyclodiphosphate synthase [Nitrospiria bacterium]
MRVGIGYDAHPFAKDRRLVIGGIEIPFRLGLAGHSDADVLLHAISDALLGAMAEGDLGTFYPDTDPRYQGISSLKLLEEVYERVAKKGYRLANLDTVLIAEQPRLASYLPLMKETIAKVLKVKEQDISIKVKSNEQMGFVGRGEGIAAQAICALKKYEKKKS